jgi:hypothetical protein
MHRGRKPPSFGAGAFLLDPQPTTWGRTRTHVLGRCEPAICLACSVTRSCAAPNVRICDELIAGTICTADGRDNPTEALQAKMLTNDEARRIAMNVARLPELLGKVEGLTRFRGRPGAY